MKNAKLALVAAAIAAGLGGAPAAMHDANHQAAFHRPFAIENRQQRRHLTKKGPGRTGNRGKAKARGGRTYTYIAGQRRCLRKLTGTRG